MKLSKILSRCSKMMAEYKDNKTILILTETRLIKILSNTKNWNKQKKSNREKVALQKMFLDDLPEIKEQDEDHSSSFYAKALE